MDRGARHHRRQLRTRAADRPLAFVVFMAGIALLLAVVARPQPLVAQEPLTAADSADVLIGAAERLEAEGSDDLARALARLVERQFGHTPAAARAAALLALMAETRIDQSGRVELIAGSTVYGAWLGVAIPLILEADSPEAYGLGLILGAPGGFLAGRAYAGGRSLTSGDARAITFGGAWGTWQGAGWQMVAEVGSERVCPDVTPLSCYDSDPEVKYTIGAMVAGGLLGIGAGMVAANNSDISAGTATLVNFGALWGTWYGVATAVIGRLDDREHGVLIPALIGGDAGLAAMAVLAPRLDMSRNRARLINAGGIIGLAIGGGIDLLLTPSDERVAMAIPTIGSIAGLWLGAELTKDYDRSPTLRESRFDLDAPSLALLGLRDGEFTLQLPQPTPIVLDAHASGTREVGVHVPLLDARF